MTTLWYFILKFFDYVIMNLYYKKEGIMRKNIVILIFVFVLFFSVSSYALTIVEGDINRLVTVYTSNKIAMSESTPKILLYNWLKKAYPDYYVGIVRFPVLAGERYTLYIKQPIDGIGRLYTLTGADPFKSSSAGISFQGVDKSKKGYYKCDALTHRINITISSKSDSSLYVVYATLKPGIPTALFLKHPSDPDALLEKVAPYPGCNPQIRQYWGAVWKDSLLLVKDPEMKESEGNKFAGNWVEKENPNSKLQIKKTEVGFYISFTDGKLLLKGVALPYGNELIGTYVLQTEEGAGSLHIFLDGQDLTLCLFTLDCRLKWRKIYTRKK